ncbi:MAG: hypothetical protein ACHP6H_02600 [Legionellales bacterium]
MYRNQGQPINQFPPQNLPSQSFVAQSITTAPILKQPIVTAPQTQHAEVVEMAASMSIDASLQEDKEINKALKNLVLLRIEQRAEQFKLETEMKRLEFESMKTKELLAKESLKIMQSGINERLQELQLEALVVQARDERTMKEMQRKSLAYTLNAQKEAKDMETSHEDFYEKNVKHTMFG